MPEPYRWSSDAKSEKPNPAAICLIPQVFSCEIRIGLFTCFAVTNRLLTTNLRKKSSTQQKAHLGTANAPDADKPLP